MSEKIVLWRKAVKDTRERRFGAECVPSSALGESAPRMTVRISDVVEVGDVQYVGGHSKLGLPCCSRSLPSPGKSKKRRAPVSPVATKNNSLLNVGLLAVLQLRKLSRTVLRSRVRKEVVAIVAMPRFSRGI